MMAIAGAHNDHGIEMLDTNRKTYLDLSLEFLEYADTLSKFRMAEARINAGEYKHGDRQCVQCIGHVERQLGELRFEMDHMPPRPEALIIEDITSRQREINVLENKEYETSGNYIPYWDWMFACDGDKDYEAFWGRASDQMRIDVIKTRELPSLEEELARTKRMTE